MKVIVGLGNPGRRYEQTAHNLGFAVVEELARRAGIGWVPSERHRAELAEGRIAGQPVLLVKPQTFMNLSGESVGSIARQRELGQDDLLAITDDVALPIGRLRLRPSGSHGGHNGLRSLIERLGTEGFARLRVGIQPPWAVEDLAAYVLAKLPPVQRGQLEQMTDFAADAAESWIAHGSKATADKINGLRPLEPPAGK